jgi:hypothetical protein
MASRGGHGSTLPPNLLVRVAGFLGLLAWQAKLCAQRRACVADGLAAIEVGTVRTPDKSRA